MVRVELDPEGRLTRFQGVPPQQDSGAAAAAAVDWLTLFEAAGLDQSRWTETASKEIPPFGFDERKAWTGRLRARTDMPLRIEAAAWKGGRFPSSCSDRGGSRFESSRIDAQHKRGRHGFKRSPCVSPPGCKLAGVAQLRAGAATWLEPYDWRRSVSSAESLGLIVAIHHVPMPAEGTHLADAMGSGLFVARDGGRALPGAGAIRAPPVAANPDLRGPDSSRADVRDPLVAGHILLGVAFGVALAILFNGVAWYQWEAHGVPRWGDEPDRGRWIGVLMAQTGC